MLASENDQLKRIYTTGLPWIDEPHASRGAKDFLSAPRRRSRPRSSISSRTARIRRPELAPGIQFFTWARRMTVDAFYTSEIGIKDIDYRGNTALAAYPEPTEAIAFALKKSNLQ